MSNRPRMKEFIHSLITKYSQEIISVKNNFKIANNFEHKWFDVKAGQQSEQTLPYAIPTIIPTQVPSVTVASIKKAYGNEDKKKNCGTNKEGTLALYLLFLPTLEVVLVYINIKGQYMVTGFVRPGTSLQHLINMVNHDKKAV